MTLAAGIIKGWSHLNALEIIRHPWFVSAFLAGGLAQTVKVLTGWVRTRRLDLRGLVEPGGMPSAHSALVTALAVAVGLTAARLRERLGHTRREVIAGVFFGIAVALGVCGFWDFWK